MNDVYLIPGWFYNFSIVMEILFSLVTLGVAIAGVRIYNIIKEKQIWRFSLGFLMISVSYASWAMLNSHIASELKEGMNIFSLINPPIMHLFGTFVYIAFFIAGLVTLAFTTFKIEKDGIFYLLLGLSLTAIVSSCSKFVTFRIISLFLITFIAFYYLKSWYSDKNKRACWTMIAFSLLVLSNIFFIFIASNTTAYIIGHIIELAAYSLILYTLIKSLRKR